MTEPGWMAEALCRQEIRDPRARANLFVPEDGHRGDRWKHYRGDKYAYAKTVCARCPVAAECLAYGLAIDDRQAIYGGLDPDERRRIYGIGRGGVGPHLDRQSRDRLEARTG